MGGFRYCWYVILCDLDDFLECGFLAEPIRLSNNCESILLMLTWIITRVKCNFFILFLNANVKGK